MRLVRFVALPLVLCACGAHTPPLRESVCGDELTVPITFVALDGHELPVPMIEATVQGIRSRFIVDTGASHHVLTRSFARLAGVAQANTPQEEGRDHTGAQVAAARLDEVHASLGGFTQVWSEAYEIEGPPVFEQLGIGGFVSPQRLVERGIVILDFPAQELSMITGGAELRDCVARERRLAPIPTEFWDGKPFVSFDVGGTSFFGELDTGGSTSEIVATEPPGPLACQGIGVSGACIEGATGTARTVRFASFETRIAPTLLEAIDHSPTLDESGLLGMDVLRACTLTLSSPAAPLLARCSP